MATKTIEQETKDTSSIGPQWPPKESSFNRIKGIDNRGVIRDSNTFIDTVDEVKKLISTHIDNPEDAIDRLSIRLIAENDVWYENLDQVVDLGEVIIPLSGTNSAFENSSIIYLGANSASRLSDECDLEKAFNNVGIATQKEEVAFSEAINRATGQGFELSILQLSDRMISIDIQNQMALLYKRFGWEKQDVIDILSKPLNIIAVARFGDEIVSAGIAEVSSVNFGDCTSLRMAEITEAATAENYQKKGLYSSVASKLMIELVDLSLNNRIDGGQIDLVFGECNGNEQGVLKAVKSLGRTFSYEVVKKANLPFKGYLPQHVPIAGAARNTKYNDLFPAFITKKKLMSLAQR